MKINTFLVILGITLVFTTLTNLPVESRGDRRHLPQDTYTAIGKLLGCQDVNATSFHGMLIRDSLGCSGGSATLTSGPTSVSADHAGRLAGDLLGTLRLDFQNKTALGESLTCEDINPTSENGPTLRNLLGCQDVNNQNSTTAP